MALDDTRDLAGDMIPTVEVATVSFPCTAMALAGDLVGLDGEESGLTTEFCRVLAEMGPRRPGSVIVENVPHFARGLLCGALKE